MNETTTHSRLQLLAAFAAVYLVWGSTYLFIHFAIETLPPFLMAGVRFILAGAILYLLANPRGTEKPTRRQWRDAAVVGLLLMLGGNGLVVWSEQHVPSGLVALIVATVPLWMVLLEWLVQGRRPGLTGIGGVVLGMLGIILLLDPASITGSEQVDLVGGIVVIIASLFWSIGSLYSRSADLPRTKFLGAAMQMLAGGAALLATGLLFGESNRVQLDQISALSIFSLLYLTIFGSVIALTAYLWLLKATTPAKVSTYAFVNPGIAVFLGWAFAGEPLGAKTLVALAIIVAAVVLVLSSRTVGAASGQPRRLFSLRRRARPAPAHCSEPAC